MKNAAGSDKRSLLLYKDKNGELLALDSIDIKILREMLEDASVSNTFLSDKLKITRSDVDHRRTSLEKRSIITRSYALDVSALGWRAGDINIDVEKGRSEQVANEIFEVNLNIEEMTIRINSTANVTARVYYRDSEELRKMIEKIKEMPFVRGVHFSEIIKVIRVRSIGKMNKIFDSHLVR